MAPVSIVSTRPVANYTVATLSDGQEIAAKTVAVRHAGSMVEVNFIDVERCTRGAFVSLRCGTSHRLALDEAVDRLNNPLKVRRVRPRPVTAEPVPTHPVKQLVSGEGFLWIGTSHRLKLVDNGESVGFYEPWKHQCRLHLRRDDATAETLIGWYQEQGAVYAAEIVNAWASRLGVHDVQVKVRTLSKRWGQARGNTITLHWALFQLPRPVVEYVIVHELAHIADTSGGKSHGTGWRRVIGRVLYDWEERERELVKYDKQCIVWMGTIAP